MSEMKVGDIGVLQNLDYVNKPFNPQLLNGYLAEIVDIGCVGDPKADYTIKIIGTDILYRFNSAAPGLAAILKHQIRPLADPDHTETTTEEEVVNAD